MKIYYISTAEIPSDKANSIQVVKMCAAMTQSGHAVCLLLPDYAAQQGYSSEDVKLHYGINSEFDIKRVKLSQFLGKPRFLWQSVNIARRDQVDLIFTRSLEAAVFGLIKNMPVILECHNLPSGKLGPLWFHLFLKLPGQKRLVIITRSLQSKLGEKYPLTLENEQMLIAPSGVDVDRYAHLPGSSSAREFLKLPQKYTVVCTGHLYEGRGMDLFLNLAEVFPGLQFVWVGGAQADVAYWRSKADQKALSNVLFTGFVQPALIPTYQAAADLLLMPYERSFSGSAGTEISDVSSPMKLFEYMASGKPIICSDLPIFREVIDETTAVLVPPMDIQAWMTAVRLVSSSPGEYQALGQRAREQAAKFAWVARSQRILAGFPKPEN